MSTVSTKLIDAATAENYRRRRRVIEDAWSIWLTDIIAALNAQRQEAGLLPDNVMGSGTLGALLEELDRCRAIGKILMVEEATS